MSISQHHVLSVAHHCRQNTLQDSTEDVKDISHQPYNDKLNRESVGTAALEILNDLRREDDDCDAC